MLHQKYELVINELNVLAVSPTNQFWSAAVMDSSTPHMCVFFTIDFETEEKLLKEKEEIMYCFKNDIPCEIVSYNPPLRASIVACRTHEKSPRTMMVWIRDKILGVLEVVENKEE